MSNVRVWRITERAIRPIELEDRRSLDSITRQLPEGYYSTFRTYEGCQRVLGLNSHLRRLYQAVDTPRVSAASLRRKLRALLEPYRPREARVRAVMAKNGQVYIAIEPLRELPPEVYRDGVRVETIDLHREYPRLKSTAFIGESASERRRIAGQGIFEALLVKDGKILEGMTSNFFYLAGEVLYTARTDILPGVTRKTVLAIARGRGVEVKFRPLKRDQLPAVTEAFITSSSRGIVPVVRIDALPIGQGSPGPLTLELMSAYESYVRKNAEPI